MRLLAPLTIALLAFTPMVGAYPRSHLQISQVSDSDLQRTSAIGTNTILIAPQQTNTVQTGSTRGSWGAPSSPASTISQTNTLVIVINTATAQAEDSPSTSRCQGRCSGSWGSP